MSIIIFTGWYFYYSEKSLNLISPVLGNSKLKQSDNVWYPKENLSKFEDAPKITAQAAYFIEINSGEVLFAKSQDQRLPIASLVKIMTTIVALEIKSPDEVLDVSSYAASVEPDKMFLIPGEQLTIKNLLDGIFLVSANDAAEVLAEKTTGRREEFINLMNGKAENLGMENTHFINPTGLEEDEISQYSTALDVAIMSRYAIANHPLVLEISSQPFVQIPKTNSHQDYEMFSGINLLSTYPGVLGLKTGFTPEAGLTLVTVAQRGDKQVLGVLLNAPERRDDARVLLDYSFKKLGV